nr:hypothetical protein [Comamonas koreensis]
MNAGVLRTIFMSLGVACILQLFLYQIQSDFIFAFLKSNITNIQIALLAMNTATLGIVLTKVREIIEKTGRIEDFESTRNEMLLSIKEQIVLVAASLFVVAVESARNFPINLPSEVFQVALIASFIYSMVVLYDTAKSVFVVLDY